MKKSLFCVVLLILALAVTPGLSADEIIFYAYGRSNAAEHPSMAGHAFVELVGYGVFGFYPVRQGSAYSDGVVRNDAGEVYYAIVSNEIVISRRQWEAAKRVIDSWWNRPPDYIIGVRDCINFVYAVAEAAGLDHDRFYTRGTALPETAVLSIR